MEKELASLKRNEVWELIDKPEAPVNIVKSKWVYKIKISSDNEITQYKARLVAKGYTQKPGIDYAETCSPMIRHSSMRILFAIAAAMDLEIDHLDVEMAFLHGDLTEEIYMLPPEGLLEGDTKNKVCRQRKALYGLKQSTEFGTAK